MMKKLENNPNNPKQKKMALFCANKAISIIKTSNITVIFVSLIVLIPLQHKTNLDHIKSNVKIIFVFGFKTRLEKNMLLKLD